MVANAPVHIKRTVRRWSLAGNNHAAPDPDEHLTLRNITRIRKNRNCREPEDITKAKANATKRTL